MSEPRNTINEMKLAVGDLVFRLYEEIYDLSAAGRQLVAERDTLKTERDALKSENAGLRHKLGAAPTQPPTA